MLDNGITELGCEFLMDILKPVANPVPLVKLKLDHNPIGTKGLELLAKGLAVN